MKELFRFSSYNIKTLSGDAEKFVRLLELYLTTKLRVACYSENYYVMCDRKEYRRCKSALPQVILDIVAADIIGQAVKEVDKRIAEARGGEQT